MDGPLRLRSALVAAGQLPDGPGAGWGTTTVVPVRWPTGAGARPRQSAMKINAAVTASTRATPTATGAGNRRCRILAGRLTGTSMVAAMIAPSRWTRTPWTVRGALGYAHRCERVTRVGAGTDPYPGWLSAGTDVPGCAFIRSSE